MSVTGARHRKPAREAGTTVIAIDPAATAQVPPAGQSASRGSSARHRQAGPRTFGTRRPRRIAVITGALVAAGAISAAAAVCLPGRAAVPQQARTAAYSRQMTGALVSGVAHAMNALPATPVKSAHHSSVTRHASAKPTAKAKPAGHHHKATKKPAKAVAAQPVYLNPLRSVSGLTPERIDMGVDFGGTGPVYALGDAVITNATGDSPGWPGGGWITYRMTSGPAAGLIVYLAEDVTPSVTVGQHVTDKTVIANMYNGGAGIETGWAMPDGASAESQLPAAGGISGGGPFPTWVGVSFERLLVALGVPEAFNANTSPFGVLPSNYPATWPGLTT